MTFEDMASSRSLLILLDAEGPDGKPMVLMRGDVPAMGAVRAAAAILRPLAAREPELVERTVGELIETLDKVDCADCPHREVCGQPEPEQEPEPQTTYDKDLN